MNILSDILAATAITGGVGMFVAAFALLIVQIKNTKDIEERLMLFVFGGMLIGLVTGCAWALLNIPAHSL